MMNWPHFPARRLLLTGAALFILAGSSPALEPRTWISLDGRTIDAELIRTDGLNVELRDKENRTLKVPKASLSFGDLDYIAEFAPEEKSAGFAPKAPAKVKVPSPAKEMKFNNKTVKKDAGEFKFGGATLKICETPHFKIFYSKGIDPTDTAELAERLWHDTAFFHSSFAAKFKDRRQPIFLVESSTDYGLIGEWYVEVLNAAGNTEGAASVKSTWDKASGNAVSIPAETAAANGVLDQATVLRMIGRGSKSTQGDDGKGVWGSFRTHVLAGDLIELQAGGLSSFAKEGRFAIFTGHSFFKEIDLTGASATSVIQKDTGKKTSSAGGYDTGRNWAAELKKRIRGGDVKPRLSTLWASDLNDAKPDDLALAYSFSRFLQSTPERHTAYSKMMQRISTSSQVPDPDSVAKLYGLEDAAALEKQWLEFVSSGDFR